MRDPTEDDITKFCDNLKESLIDLRKNGLAVCIDQEHASAPMYVGGVEVDRSYTGCTWIISVGEPSAQRRYRPA